MLQRGLAAERKIPTLTRFFTRLRVGIAVASQVEGRAGIVFAVSAVRRMAPESGVTPRGLEEFAGSVPAADELVCP